MTISTNVHLLRPVFGICSTAIPSSAVRIFHFQDGGDVTNPAGLSRVSCFGSAKAVQCPVPGQKLATKVSKSRAIPSYVPGVNPPGMAADKYITHFASLFTLKREKQRTEREMKNYLLISFVTTLLIEFLVPCIAHQIPKNAP